MRCFDPGCAEPGRKELRGLRMCVGHYIEALEHSAHLNFGSWNGQDASSFGDMRMRHVLEGLWKERREKLYGEKK